MNIFDNIFFTPTSEVDDLMDSGAFLTTNGGYLYRVELSQDDIIIHDSVGRSVPIDAKSLPNLVDALIQAQAVYDAAEAYTEDNQ